MNLTLAIKEMFEGNEVEIYQLEDGSPVMTVDGLAKSLGYADRNGVQKIMDRNEYLKDIEFSTEDKLSLVEGSRNVTRDVRIFTEDGIYEVTMLSHKPKAKEFRAFVRRILKSLRKGEVKLVRTESDYVLPTNFREALYMLAETVGERDELQEVVKNNKEKVILANAITSSDEGLLIEAAAKYMRQNGVNIGRDRLFEWLREQKYLISRKGREWNMPTQRAIEQGFIKVHNSLYYDSEGELKTNRQVVVTGKGLLYFINKFLRDGQLKLEV